MSDHKYDSLKLENQICFPLYAASRKVTSKYRTVLAELDLTYTQYISMMVLWEHGELNVKELGERLYLDSGTLTPVLKSLEQKGYVERKRSSTDERVLNVTLTETGLSLRDRALSVPYEMASCVSLSIEEAIELQRLLNKLLECM